MAFTRRTHVVRISDAKPGDPPSDTYVDVEVLDAISFIGPQGKEMVLNMPQKKVRACIKDDTGGGHEKSPGSSATRLSHMKRIIGDDSKQQLDVEVVDVLSFRDPRGEEWILDMHAANGQPSVFNTTDGSGDSKATRRVHTEKIKSNGGKAGNDSTEFLSIERCDTIAFRTISGKEMVVQCPSADDGTGARASTHIWSPEGYDPDNPNGPKPPPNEDENTYVAFIDEASGFVTGKTKIAQGPFWWIRKFNASGPIVFVKVDYLTEGQSAPTAPTIKLINMPYPGTWSILDSVNQQINPGANAPPIVNPVTGSMLSSFYQWTPSPVVEEVTKDAFKPSFIYYVDSGDNITAENYKDTYPFGTDQCGRAVTYVGAFGGTFLNCDNTVILYNNSVGFNPVPQLDNGGFFSSLEAAQYFAEYVNNWLDKSGWSFTLTAHTLQVAAGDQTFRKSGSAVFELNVAQMRDAFVASLGVGAAAPTKVNFTISVGPNSSGTVNIGAQGYKTLRDFKLDSKNVPQFDWGPQGTFTVAFNSSENTVIGSIDLKTLEVTFSTNDPPPKGL